MIKVFRKIRQRFILENRVDKYFAYAIGEIVLVVIGILIALQIDNWNEDRKERKMSAAFLKEIHKDLQTDTLEFNNAMRQLESLIRRNMIVLGVKKHEVYSDTIWLAIHSGYFHKNMNLRTFQKIQNSGRTALLGYEDLYNDISLYYTKEHDDLERYLAFDLKRYEIISGKIGEVNSGISENQVFESKLENWLEQFPEMNMAGLKHVTLSDSDMSKRYLDFVNSIEGRNILTQHVRRSSLMWEKYQSKRNAVIKLMQGIEAALGEKLF